MKNTSHMYTGSPQIQHPSVADCLSSIKMLLFTVTCSYVHSCCLLGGVGIFVLLCYHGNFSIGTEPVVYNA